MPYPIAPWIRPANDLGEDYLGGLRAGAEIAHQQAALAQQASLHSMELGLKQQQMARENAIEQQKLEVTKAYHTQQTQLMSQRLEQAQQSVQLKTQEAAQRFAAKQAYQKDLEAGVAPLDAIMKNFPGTDESMTGYGQLARMMAGDKKPVPPPSVENIQVGKRSIPYLKIPEANGGYRMQSVREAGRDVQGDAMTRMRIRELERKRDRIESDIEKNYSTFDGMSDEDVKALQAGGKRQYAQYQAKKKELTALDSKIDQVYEGDQGEAPPPDPRQAPPPGTGGDDRVKVRAPSGKTGTIPADQLDEALKAGYARVDSPPERGAPAPDAVTAIGTMPASNGEMPFGPSPVQTPWSAPATGPRPPAGMMPHPALGQSNEDAVTQYRKAMFLQMMQRAAQQGAIRPEEDLTGAGNTNPEAYAPYDLQGHPHYAQ